LRHSLRLPPTCLGAQAVRTRNSEAEPPRELAAALAAPSSRASCVCVREIETLKTPYMNNASRASACVVHATGRPSAQTLASTAPVFPLHIFVAPLPEGPPEVHEAPKDDDGAAASPAAGGAWQTQPSRPPVCSSVLAVSTVAVAGGQDSAPSCPNSAATRLGRRRVRGFGAWGPATAVGVGLWRC
jgi:hypothetical protein